MNSKDFGMKEPPKGKDGKPLPPPDGKRPPEPPKGKDGKPLPPPDGKRPPEPPKGKDGKTVAPTERNGKNRNQDDKTLKKQKYPDVSNRRK